jgi:RHS repeat-associated protein
LYHLTDALGSVRQLADSSGNVQLARGYTPYGEPLWTNGTASSRYAFTGEDYDPAVGLVFLRARYMQPMLGLCHLSGYTDPVVVGKQLCELSAR